MLESKVVDLDFIESCCSANVLPEVVLGKGSKRVYEERKSVVSRLPEFGVVYGFNTLTGHRDNVMFSESNVEAFNQSLLDSHCIGRAPWFTEREVSYLVFAKIYSLSLGGSGVSLAVYDKLCSVWLDKSVFSAKIPCADSYSSGDVIPGAHLARFLRHDAHCEFQIGDMMAIINGNYVHAGYALSIRESLVKVFYDQLHTVANSLSVVKMDVEWMNRLISFIDYYYPAAGSAFRSIKVTGNSCFQQVSVSFRAIPELIQACWMAMHVFNEAMSSCFSRCSANPLFVNNGRSVVSQASFISPELSLASSQLVDALQFCAWQSLRRIIFMLNPLSGNRQDAAGEDLDLGLIQVPKRLQARLDAQRLASSTRPFSLGSSASCGVEDSWTYGVVLVSQLKNLIKLVQEILVEETAVGEYIEQAEKGHRVSYTELVGDVAFSRNLDFSNE